MQCSQASSLSALLVAALLPCTWAAAGAATSSVRACLSSEAARAAAARPTDFASFNSTTAAPASLLPAGEWASAKVPAQRLLTVASFYTPARLGMVDGLCAAWPGPLAAVVYLPLPAEAPQSHQALIANVSSTLQQLAAKHESTPGSCSLDLLLVTELVQPDMLHQFPVNSLRNLGLLLARTSLVTVLDADFLPSQSLADELADPAGAANLTQLLVGRKQAVVLPALQSLPPVSTGNAAEDALSHKLTSLARASDKATLQRMAELGLLEQFLAEWPPGHADTRFDHWFRFEGEHYPIQPKHDRYEPWVVQDRALALQYPWDEAFRGRGANGWSRIYQLRARGWEFLVHGRAFIVHRVHPRSAAFHARRHIELVNERSQGRMRLALTAGTYRPGVAPNTAACMQQALTSAGARQR